MKLAAGLVRKAVPLLAVALAVSAASAQESHFSFSGPMSSFMPEGATPGAVTSGLPFAIVLTDNGASISPAEVELRGTGWKGPITLRLAAPKFAGGRLSGTVQLQNGSGSTIEGVRLDILGASEEYKAKDENGNDVVKTRSQAITVASPLLFGDLPLGHLSEPLPLEVSGITFAPETVRVTVSGVLSGLYYIGSMAIPDTHDCRQIDVDSGGRVYVADTGGYVWRIDPDSKKATVAGTLPSGCYGVAVNPKTGDIYARCLGENRVFHFRPGGDDQGQLTEDAEVDTTGAGVRLDHAGNLWAIVDGGLQRFRRGVKDLEINDANGESLDARLFDVDAAGNIWVCSNDKLFEFGALGQHAKQVAFGPDWHLGRVMSPISCRADADGSVYVLESGIQSETEREAPRISVFDKDGRIIRVFGRGGETDPGQGEPYPGQLAYAKDIAFGSGGRVYVVQDDYDNLVMVFSKF